jgi:predicted short-subunit dehydrogenase-like oxidoreductase (DUF2520 family)
MSKAVSIIGAGVVGKAVGHLLRQKGHTIKGVCSRSLENAKAAVEFIGEGEPGTDPVTASRFADWVLIATPDRAIKETCDKVSAAKGFKKRALVVHFSGALSSDELASARGCGARVASLHPIQSLASVGQAVKNLPGSYFSLEGDPEAMDEGREIVEALGGLLILIPTDKKALYHAAAAVASNYLATVVDFSLMIYESIGMDREEAARAVMPLIRGTVDNIERVGLPDALTGPIARGDIATVEGHLSALAKTMPQMVRLYSELGKHTVRIGMAKGTLGPEDGYKMLEVLSRRI